jgi:hypothetical protein
MLQSALCITLCPLLVAQQISEPDAISPAKPATAPGNRSKTPKAVRIPAGSTVRLRLDQQISSADAQVGDRVRFTIVGGLEVENRIVIPDGTAFFAIITAVRPKTPDHYGEVGFSDPELDLGSGQRIRLTGNDCVAYPAGCVAYCVLVAVTLVPISAATLPISGALFLVDKIKQDNAQRRLTALGVQKPVKAEKPIKGDRSREEYPEGQTFDYYTRQGARIRPDLIASVSAAMVQSQPTTSSPVTTRLSSEGHELGITTLELPVITLKGEQP